MWHIELSLGNKLKAKEKTTIAREQIRKYATVLEPLLDSSPRSTMEVLLEAVFSMWSPQKLYRSTD
jgi:hypothetical protein